MNKFFQKFNDFLGSVAVSSRGRGVVLVLVAIMFFIGILWNINLPGLYMDEVNPDYLVARFLAPRDIPVWLLPYNNFFPTLGQLYHGLLPAYLGGPFFLVFGTSVASLRLVHALFGLVILLLLYVLLKKLTKNFWWSVVPILLLAVEPAFVYAWRTQCYINLLPMVFILLSVIVLLRIVESAGALKPVTRIMIFSGICYGLAVYGYFIHLFFLPAFIVLLFKLKSVNCPKWKLVSLWLLGLLIGLLPYIYGYINLFFSWGSNWLSFRSHIKGLVMSFSGGPLIQPWTADLLNFWHALRDSITNNFTQSMTFSLTTSNLNRYKIYLILVFIGVSFIKSLFGREKRQRQLFVWYVIFIFSYLGVAALFNISGGRLWSHHVVPIVPLLYLGLGLSLATWFSFEKNSDDQLTKIISGVIVGGACLFLVLVSINEQVHYQKNLLATGGVHYYTEAINQLATEALKNPPGTTYAFPEWGFFMPFAFITGGRVPYIIDVNEAYVKKILCDGQDVRIFHWFSSPNQDIKNLKDFNLDSAEQKIYYQRNQVPVFYSNTYRHLEHCRP